jgi:hypothetical protein
MDLTDAAMPHVISNAACARTLDIFLDKLSLDASTTTRHLLDADFSGEFVHIVSGTACSTLHKQDLPPLFTPHLSPLRHRDAGVFDLDELALRGHLMAFQQRLRGNAEARNSSGYAAVRETLRSLGARPEWET